MSAGTSTIVAAGRIAPKTSPWTRPIAADDAAMSTTNIRVRTTSASEKPPSSRARPTISKAARACAAASPGWRDRPSGPASVVPATQHESPTTTARL
ncbi:MAG TPA: hypothetical protein VGQ58_09420 [Candidatus Limnocylindrales bacterium]|jgi:hypothetical protein|nr:hypothetical protein [Candidatus Limnocylindrales bacterium]